jgi:hypothetical protein
MNQAHRAQRAENQAVLEAQPVYEAKDKEGRSFDPALHLMLKDGSPRISTKGFLYCRPKRSLA